MKKHLIILSAAFLWACSAKKEGETAGTIGGIDVEGAIKEAENRRQTDPDASGGNKCLMGYQTKLDQLLTADLVIRATGFSEGGMDSAYTRIMGPAYHDVQYKFKNGRMGQISGLNGQYPLKDHISLGGIKPISLAQFKDSYRVMSEEEAQIAKDAFEEVTEGKGGDKQADEALKKAKEKNIDKETVKKAGGALMNAFREVSEGYRLEKDLGDAARWNAVTNRMTVLQNGVQFELSVEVSNDSEKNRETARTIAKEILKKCD